MQFGTIYRKCQMYMMINKNLEKLFKHGIWNHIIDPSAISKISFYKSFLPGSPTKLFRKTMYYNLLAIYAQQIYL